MHRFRWILPAAMVAITFAAPARAQLPFDVEALFITKQVVNLTVRPGVTVRYLLGFSNVVPPTRTIILFAGDDGLLAMTPTGAVTTDLQHNFLVRSRWVFAHRGLHVAVVDTPGATGINGGIRLSAQYADDIGKVIQDVRVRSGGLPVWLIGTSSGTLSAAGVAARRPLIAGVVKPNWSRPDGIVLTSTQSKLVDALCGKTVFDAKLKRINVPAFAAAHKHDKCACSPPKKLPEVLAALAYSPAKDSQVFTGGLPAMSVNDCDALNPHGFYGIENPVISAIANWIKTH